MTPIQAARESKARRLGSGMNVMGYAYEAERPKLFTEEGQRAFLRIRDAARELLDSAGAFRQQEALRKANLTGDLWFQVACLDRLVELREVVKLPRDSWEQYTVYTRPVST